MVLTTLLMVGTGLLLHGSGTRTLAARRSGVDKQIGQLAKRTAEEEERVKKIADLSKYWGEHQEELERLLHKEYPEAMARWKSVAPEAKAVEEYGKNYEAGFAQRNQAAIAAFQARNSGGADLLLRYGPCGRLCLCQTFVREWENSAEVLPGRTVGQTYREMLSEPQAFEEIRDIVVATERGSFQDEKAAKLVAALSSSEAVLDYLRGARARYDTAAQNALAEAGFDVVSRELLPGMMDAEAVRGLTMAYRQRSERELNQMREQMDKTLRNVDVDLLAESSADDAESRRLLTEWKDLRTVRQKMGEAGQ